MTGLGWYAPFDVGVDLDIGGDGQTVTIAAGDNGGHGDEVV